MADFIGTEKEQLTIHFDFPDAVLPLEREQMVKDLTAKTGWPIVFSSAVRQDLLHVYSFTGAAACCRAGGN